MAVALIVVIGLPWVDRLPWPESMRAIRVDTLEDQGIAKITKNSLDRVESHKTIPHSPWVEETLYQKKLFLSGLPERERSNKWRPPI